MARITVRICLFTLIALSHSLILNNSAHARLELPLDYHELLYLPESKSAWQTESEFERYFKVDCNFQHRFELAIVSESRNEFSLESLITDSEFDAPPVPRPVEKVAVAAVDKMTDPFGSVPVHPIHTRQSSLMSNWRIAEQNIMGFCSWAGECIQPSVSIKSTNNLLPPKKRNWHLAPVQQRIALPLFVIANQPAKTQSLKSLARHHIPMFLVSGQSADELESLGESETQEVNATESPISIEVENDDSDAYWQYYDDCDRWGVDFAKLLFQAKLTEPTLNQFASSNRSFVVTASYQYEVSPVETEPFALNLMLFRTLTAQAPCLLLSSVPPIFDFKAQSLNELMAIGEFKLVEQLNEEPELVYVRPLGPITQLLVVHHRLAKKPVYHFLATLRDEIKVKSISCHIYQAQAEYSEHIEVLVVKAQQANRVRQNQFRHRVADQIAQLAGWLDDYADSLRPTEAPIVATNPTISETK